MKNRILIIFSIILIALLSLTSCDPSEPKEPGESSGNESIKTNITPLDEANAVSIRPYCVMYSEIASEKEKASAVKVYEKIQELCGVIISSTSDYLGRGDEVPADAAEIVIGKTNRKDFTELRYSDYTIRREGKRIYICGGSAASTETAVELFISNYLCANGILIPDGGYYDHTAKYSLEKLTVEGVDIGEFKVFAENKSDAYLIQESLGNVIGWELQVDTKKTDGQHYIILDDTFGNLEGYEISIGGGNLTLRCNKYTADEAISYLKDKYFTSLSGTEINMTKEHNVKIYTDQKQEFAQYDGETVEIRDRAKELKLTQEVMDDSVVSRGNRVRLANVLRKAQNGEPVTVGMIGGSITQGSAKPTGYANLFKAWWESEFPSSKLTFINAGIGATGSMIGVHRVENDLLYESPDLVIIDFSVNDTNNDLAKETYESLVRKILKQENSPAVILMFFFNQSGDSVQGRHSEVGFNYSLPMISYKDAVWPEGKDKLYEWNELSNDSVHPNITGHAIAAELLINYIQNVEENLALIDERVESKLPAAITKASFDDSTILTRNNITPTTLGSFTDNTDTSLQFKNGWITKGGDQAIEFNLWNVNSIYLLYYKDHSGASGKADVLLNGEKITTLDADATKEWGSYAKYEEIVPSQNKNVNFKLSIKLSDDSKNKSFSILGIMVSYYTPTPIEPDEATMKMWEEYVDGKLEAANLSETEKEKSFIFIADTHWNENSMYDSILASASHVLKYASDSLGGATVIHGGDLFGGFTKKANENYPYNNVNYYRETALDLVENYMTNELYSNFGTNFLYAFGNHDTNIIGYRNVRDESKTTYYDKTLTADMAAERYLISDKDMYNSTVGLLGNTVVYDEEGIKELRKIMTELKYSETQLKEAEYMMRMHYYRDDAERKIRYIVVDTGGCGRTQMSLLNLGYCQYIPTQYKWFANTLKSTPSGYDVVVIGHELSDVKEYHAYDKNTETEFTTSQYINPIFDILTAFKLGEKVTVSQSPLAFAMDKSEFARAFIQANLITDFDFEKKFEGNIITLAGHEHLDLAWYINNDAKGTDKDVMFGSSERAGDGAILAINTGAANPYSTNPENQRNDGITMKYEGTESLRFDIVTLRDDGSVLLTRIGAGRDRVFAY